MISSVESEDCLTDTNGVILVSKDGKRQSAAEYLRNLAEDSVSYVVSDCILSWNSNLDHWRRFYILSRTWDTFKHLIYPHKKVPPSGSKAHHFQGRIRSSTPGPAIQHLALMH